MGKARRVVYEPVEMPARLTPFHVRDRETSTIAGAPRAWSNIAEHPLTLAFRKGQIGEDEFAAGEVYRSFFEKIGKSGRDSTEFIVVSGSSPGLSCGQLEAGRIIGSIEKNMAHERSRAIVRKFCGEAWTASEAARAAGYLDPRDVWKRIPIALNKLSAAIAVTRIPFGRLES